MLVFFLILLIILGSLIVLLALSTIQLQINNLHIKDNRKIDGEIKIVLKVLKIIPYLEINLLDSKFIKKQITLQNLEKNMNKSKIKIYKSELKQILEITKLEELYVKINFESENIFLMTFATVILSTILSIIFAKNMIEKEEGKFGINMKYSNNTNYEIYLNSIINVKVIHIISVMCESLKRKRADKNARKSYRRTYEYNHE